MNFTSSKRVLKYLKTLTSGSCSCSRSSGGRRSCSRSSGGRRSCSSGLSCSSGRFWLSSRFWLSCSCRSCRSWFGCIENGISVNWIYISTQIQIVAIQYFMTTLLNYYIECFTWKTFGTRAIITTITRKLIWRWQ